MKRAYNLLLKDNGGRTSIESLATMLLMIILGVGVCSLTLSSISAYQKIYNSKKESSESRVAISFITTKIRQNDCEGRIDIKPDPFTGQNALVIYENIDNTDYATWIFHYEGFLYEALILRAEAPSIEISQPVAKIAKFEINPVNDGIVARIGNFDGMMYESYIRPKSGLRIINQ